MPIINPEIDLEYTASPAALITAADARDVHRLRELVNELNAELRAARLEIAALKQQSGEQ